MRDRLNSVTVRSRAVPKKKNKCEFRYVVCVTVELENDAVRIVVLDTDESRVKYACLMRSTRV